MKIKLEELRQIIREELARLQESDDAAGQIKMWLDDKKPTTDVSRKKMAKELAKKLASGSGRANLDRALQTVRKDIHAAKDTDQSKQDKLAALSAELDDPDALFAFASTSGKSKLPPLV